MKFKHLSFLLLVISGSACSASFDCKKAATTVEKMICSDEQLSKLDDELAVSYKQTLEETNDKNQILKEQLAWLKTRNLCVDSICVAKEYERRINTLKRDIEGMNLLLPVKKAINEIVYPDNYKRVDIHKTMPRGYSVKSVRPANSFKLVASRDIKICSDVLAILNQPGIYKGVDTTYWWISNNALPKWTVVEKGYADYTDDLSIDSYVPGQLEELIADIDGDGNKDYAYRYSHEIRGQLFQDIAIFSESLIPKNVSKELNLGYIGGYVLADYFDSKNGRWLSATYRNNFFQEIYQKNNLSYQYNFRWFSNLFLVDKNYGIIFYPQGSDPIEYFYGSLTKNSLIDFQCVFAPQSSQP